MDLKDLLSDVDAYCARTRTAVSVFGELVANDRSLIARLRVRGDCKLSTIARIRAFMAENPDGPPPRVVPLDQRGAA